ncbi:hypothetical protein V1523DRAFT_424339 [Lipomyces doorenjongii]
MADSTMVMEVTDSTMVMEVMDSATMVTTALLLSLPLGHMALSLTPRVAAMDTMDQSLPDTSDRRMRLTLRGAFSAYD